jgi:hypothetical protein
MKSDGVRKCSTAVCRGEKAMTFFKKIWGLMSKVIQPFFQTAVIVAAIYIIASLYVNKNEVSAKYVEIAANVLSRETTKDDKVLRKWAVDIINKEAPVPWRAN